MSEVLKERKKSEKAFDTCVIEMPREFAVANGLPEKSFVSLTLRNGKLESEIIVYNDRDEKEVEDFLENFPAFNEEMKRIGD
jgi:hypothetical protein